MLQRRNRGDVKSAGSPILQQQQQFRRMRELEEVVCAGAL
jgi:hypothetical protein